MIHSEATSSKSNAAPQTGGVRFAPSPTGRFHVGNLRTAYISYLWSRALKLPWVVRYEDIDRPRVLPGAQQLQASDMRELGMRADVELVQSEFYSRHLELFERARREGAVYACDCSRKDVQTALAGLASAPNDGGTPIYSGACRAKHTPPNSNAVSIAWRLKMPREDGHDDVIIARTAPDGFVFVPSYHWACAIDDFDGAYDLLVRSIDLAPAAFVQRAIQTWLMKSLGVSRALPRLFHTTLVTQNDGHRLEKRTQGVTLDELHSSGITTVRLLELFDQSFDSSLLTTPFSGTGDLQELQTALSLSKLGL